MKNEQKKMNEKGGYVCMPLKKNIKEPQSADWKLTRCPECNVECWEQPLVKLVERQGVKALCTKCVLKKYGE